MATFYVQDVYNIKGVGIIPVGKVESGIIKLGMQANLGSTVVKIKSIEMHHEKLQEAKEGLNVGILVEITGNFNPVNPSFFGKLLGGRSPELELMRSYMQKRIDFN